jgi:hypothetical protein
MPEEYLLPFLCADVTPRELRVPGGAARKHSNGATGIRRIEVMVSDVWGYSPRLNAVLGEGPTTISGIGGALMEGWEVWVKDLQLPTELRLTSATTEGIVRINLWGTDDPIV